MAYSCSVRFSTIVLVAFAVSQVTVAWAAEADMCLLQSKAELTEAEQQSSGRKRPSLAQSQETSVQPMAAHAKSSMLIQGHHASGSAAKWVDHGNFKATKMDQGTLPADSKHVRMKTMTADWHQEYPTAAPMHFFNPMKSASTASGSILI